MNHLPPPDPKAPVRGLIWLYFWLLIFEGVLRKWVLPQYSDLLFVVRDPVVLMIYFFALRANVFPLRPAVAVVVAMALGSLVFSLANEVPITVVLFGLRTNYFHLPLVFVMAEVLDQARVMKIGKWCLIAAVPITVLMIYQFNSPPTHWVNGSAGAGEGLQLRGAMGKIRPPGPFSFVSGTVNYFSVVAAFVFAAWLRPAYFPRTVRLLGTVALIVAVPISISRSLLLCVLIVAAFAATGALKDPRRLPRLFGPLIAAASFIIFAGDTIYVQAFVTRWDEAVTVGSGGFYSNIVERMLEPFLDPFRMAADVPLFGYGVGMGTVAGARLMTGEYTFLLGESELARIVLELGPLLGFIFIGWRVWLVSTITFRSWRAVVDDANPLPWLLTGATFLNVLSGQWGPATTLGFAVFGAGLALAAANRPEAE